MVRATLGLLLLVLGACASTGGALRAHKSQAPTGRPPTPLVDPRGFRIHVIDVGQGSATLLEFPCAAVLIDTGGEDSPAFHSTEHLLAYLDWFFASRPDLGKTLALLVVTHPHLDHTRGVEAVVGRYKVERVVTDGLVVSSGAEQQQWLLEHAKQAGLPSFVVSAHALPPGGVTNDVLDPVKCQEIDPQIHALWGAVDGADARHWDPEAVDDANNHSVVLRVDVGDASALLLGDVETSSIDDLVKAQGTALDVDVMQVAHHGSHHSTTSGLVEAVSPELAVITVGDPERQVDYSAWKWGHPRKVAMRMLIAAVSGVRPPVSIPVAMGMKRFERLDVRRAIYGTGWDGDIVIELVGDAAPKIWTTR